MLAYSAVCHNNAIRPLGGHGVIHQLQVRIRKIDIQKATNVDIHYTKFCIIQVPKNKLFNIVRKRKEKASFFLQKTESNSINLL